MWSLWVAAGLVFVGGLLPFVFGGTSSRMTSVVVPFTIAAVAFTACGFLHTQGRLVTAILYFIGGLAVVYGVLSMFSVPLELAVLGSCPAAPAACSSGLPRTLSSGENTGMGFAAGFGLLALFIGFFGLMVVFRTPVIPIPPPPERTIPPVAPATPAAAKAAENGGAVKPVEDEPELPAHVEEELPELPPHESDPPRT